MQTDTAPNTKADQVDNLLSQMHHILDVHRTELGEQELEHELEWLTEWVEHISKTSTADKEQIDDHALAMLSTIYDKLAEATNEERRMQAESPLDSETANHHLDAIGDTRKDVGRLMQSFSKHKETMNKTAHRA